MKLLKPYYTSEQIQKYRIKGEKLLSLRMTKEPCFTYADFDTYVTRAYLTVQPTGLNYKYALALFNSKLYYYWLFNMGKRKGKQLQIDQAQILELPIFVPDIRLVNEIVSLIDIIIESGEEQSLEQISIIDNYVYELYGLTEHEIETVESFIDEQRNS